MPFSAIFHSNRSTGIGNILNNVPESLIFHRKITRKNDTQTTLTSLPFWTNFQSIWHGMDVNLKFKIFALKQFLSAFKIILHTNLSSFEVSNNHLELIGFTRKKAYLKQKFRTNQQTNKIRAKAENICFQYDGGAADLIQKILLSTLNRIRSQMANVPAMAEAINRIILYIDSHRTQCMHIKTAL